MNERYRMSVSSEDDSGGGGGGATSIMDHHNHNHPLRELIHRRSKLELLDSSTLTSFPAPGIDEREKLTPSSPGYYIGGCNSIVLQRMKSMPSIRMDIYDEINDGRKRKKVSIIDREDVVGDGEYTPISSVDELYDFRMVLEESKKRRLTGGEESEGGTVLLEFDTTIYGEMEVEAEVGVEPRGQFECVIERLRSIEREDRRIRGEKGEERG